MTKIFFCIAAIWYVSSLFSWRKHGQTAQPCTIRSGPLLLAYVFAWRLSPEFLMIHRAKFSTRLIVTIKWGSDLPHSQKTYLQTWAPSEDSDQPAHSRSLIRIFTGRFLDSQVCNVSLCGQRKLWSDCADAQADLSLRWAHISEGTFSHVGARMADHLDNEKDDYSDSRRR